MKIAYFSDSYVPYTSGVVTSMRTFANGLEQRGHEVIVYAPTYPDYSDDDDDDHIHRVPSVPFPAYRGLRLALPHPAIYDDDLGGVDIIHSHSAFAMGLAGAAAAKKHDAALVFTVHSIYEDYFIHYPVAPKVLKHITRQYTIFFCQLCDAVVAPSYYVRDRLLELGIETPIEVIPTGIDLAKFTTSTDRLSWRHQHEIPTHAKVLLSVGRLAKEKNLSLLLQAFVSIMKHTEDTYLTFAGDGPDREELQAEAAALDIQHRVIFLGQLDREEVIQAYGAADLFLFASTMETQGLCILEAMASSLPVVAIDSPACRELVQHGVSGLLLPEDEQQIASGVCNLLVQPQLLQSMSREARVTAEEFSKEKMAQRMESLYQSLRNNTY